MTPNADNTKVTIQIARWTIAFSWIYHGLMPKLWHIAPLEWQMTKSLGLSDALTRLTIQTAGIAEVIFGCLLYCFYQNKSLIKLNIAALIGLLLVVVVQTPMLLIEAFNPITTNLPLIALSFILLKQHK